MSAKKALISFTGYDDETFDFLFRYNSSLTAKEHIPMLSAYLSAALEQFSHAIAENSTSQTKLEIAQEVLDLIQSDLDSSDQA